MTTKHKHIKVVFCIPNMVIGGVETVFVNTVNELLKNHNLDITIITHAKIRESVYVNWLKSHPELPVFVYYPMCNWFEDLAPKCRGILKPIRRILFSLYKKYRRVILYRKFRDIDVFVDYKNFEFFKELHHLDKPKIAWVHASLSYCESNDVFSHLPQYTKIVAITDEFVDDFRAKHPQYANKIVRIYNPLDVKDIQSKAKLATTPRGKYFCHVSRLVDGKDIKTLLDGFDLFAKSHKNIKLYIVGDGNKAREFKEYAGKLKSAKQIVFIGALDNPFGLMRGPIANILSSEHEGFGMVLTESMALRTLIISSDYKCGAKEILENGKNGLLFEIGNAQMLADCMSKALDSKFKEKLIQRAYKSLSRFSVNKMTKQITDLLQLFGGNE